MIKFVFVYFKDSFIYVDNKVIVIVFDFIVCCYY